MHCQSLCKLLNSVHFRFKDELELHHGMELLFDRHGVKFEPEASLTPQDRIDFLVGSIGIEAKVDYSLNQLIRQLHRYTKSAKITEVIVLSTKSAHRNVPHLINGKPIYVVILNPFF